MMRLFINGLAANAGGGLTYLRNVIPQIAARSDVEASVLLGSSLRRELGSFRNISFLQRDSGQGAAQRFAWEQLCLPAMVRQAGADVLISTGNFALRKSPVPQVLLSRNSLYTSREFTRDLRARKKYFMWLDTAAKGFAARKSIHWADITVAPSEAFAATLRNWAGAEVTTIPHGFDKAAFLGGSTALPAEAREELETAQNCLRLLFVSHYNYYRNFETLLRALPFIRDRLHRPVRLFLTCRLEQKPSLGGYSATQAAALIKQLGIAENVVELGTIPYRALARLYSACHLYVSPAYAESFAHPLVEAMSAGLPVVASDLSVHREICGNAALYFNHQSPDELAQRVIEVADSQTLTRKLSDRGLSRCLNFSWKKHVEELLALAARLMGQTASPEQLQAVS